MSSLSRAIVAMSLSLIISCATGSRAIYLIPSSEESSKIHNLENERLIVHTWVMITQLRDTDILGAFVRVASEDSVTIDLSHPKTLTERGMMTVDAISIWRFDTISGGQQSLLNISGQKDISSTDAKLELGPGVYLAQIMTITKYHEEVFKKDFPVNFELGNIYTENEAFVQGTHRSP